jgi:hypothetical protein
VIGGNERELGGGIHLRAGFRVRLAVDGDIAGENQRTRPLARGGEPLVDDELIKPHTQFLQP